MYLTSIYHSVIYTPGFLLAFNTDFNLSICSRL
jgi:hypothetical protein